MISQSVLSQEPAIDSIGNGQDTLFISADSIAIHTDSLTADTISADTTVVHAGKKQSPIEEPVKYNARDSMDISVQDQKLYLYGDAKVTYQNIELTADYIVFDMSNNVVLASRLADNDTSETGKPVFKQGSETFSSDTIKYNFKSKKGIIKQIVTNQGDGYLHAAKTKRQADGHIHIKGGKYTTCDLEHPHFYIGLTKAISTDKKIVSGPAYFVMEDIPLPLVIPFGFFPSSKNRSAGILMPTYGESAAEGFYLRNGGLYIPINDYVDFALQGDIYTRGSWGFGAKTNYYWKYHFKGGFGFNYILRTRKDEFPRNQTSHYSITWYHNQDPKANPTRTFAANVNITSPTYNKYYSNNYQDLRDSRGRQQSSISYSKKIGNLFLLSTALNYSQNNQDSTVDMTLPEGTFSLMQPFYPFRPKVLSGKPKWFQNISINYKSRFTNQINNTKTTMLFEESTLRNMKNGYTHEIPITLTNLKVLKFINIVPSLRYYGTIYGSRVEKRLPDGILFGKNLKDSVIVDTIRGLQYAHSLTPGIGFNINPKLYGILQSKNPTSYIQAIRHVITPSVSFSFTPNMSRFMNNYRENISYTRSVGEDYYSDDYYIYENSPSAYEVRVTEGGRSPISFSLGNNLEMKVLSKKDTTGKPVKVPILNNLNFNTSFDPNKDSVKWSKISMNGSTGLFKNKINITFNGIFNPYAVDKNGRSINTSYLKETGKLLSLENFYVSVGMNFSSAGGSQAGSQEQNENLVEYDDMTGFYTDYADFDIPWSFSMNYSWRYSKLFNAEEKSRITQTLSVSGQISLTKKWKIGGNTGYDFDRKQLITSNINISRDLHCWEMSFNIVPFGQYRSYNFTIRAKGSFLRDLKWDKRKRWEDYLY